MKKCGSNEYENEIKCKNITFVYDKKNSLSMPKADLFQSMSRLLHRTDFEFR